MTQKRIKISVENPLRPSIPDYGISEELKDVLTWDHVNKWMDESHGYWIATVGVKNKPHVRPIWGIWHENVFYFGGGDTTQNAKNLQRDPRITVHTESSRFVVIVEGKAEQFEDEDLHQILGNKYKQRYNLFHPPPFWRVIPEIVFTWDVDDYAKTPTKFICKVEYLG